MYNTILINLIHLCPEFQNGTVSKEFYARLANRPFLVFEFLTLALKPEHPSVRKSKTKNGWLASLAWNP